MTISHKKINRMIAKEIHALNADDHVKEQLLKICNKAYALESSVDSIARNATVADIKKYISSLAIDRSIK